MTLFNVELWADEAIEVWVDGEFPDVTVAGKTLSPEMAAHVFRFGMRQLIRDAGAISKDAAAKPNADEVRNNLALKKVKALQDGTLREHVAGPRLTPLEHTMRAIALRAAEAQQPKATRKVQAELADKILRQRQVQIKRMAEEEMERALEFADDLVLEAETQE